MATKSIIVRGGSSDAPAIDPEQTLKAARALVEHMKKDATENATAARETKKGLNPLLDEDDQGASVLSETPVILFVATKTFIATSNKLRPHKIPLPHPLATPSSDASICLIVADPQRAYKEVIASADFPAPLRQRIGRVIGFDKLKQKYRVFEAQRQLYAEHDVFLADDRIVTRLPKILGKTFYKSTTKRPVPVILAPPAPAAGKNKAASKGAPPKGTGLRPRVKAADALSAHVGKPGAIAKEITRAIGAAAVHLTASPSTAVRVGYADWAPADLVENVAVVARDLVEKWVPRKWANVRGIYLKGPRTTALPIWLAEELWVDEEGAVSKVQRDAGEEEKGEGEGTGEAGNAPEAAKEKANTKKKRKALGSQPVGLPEKPAKKSKSEKQKENAAVVEKISASRKAKLEKEKAIARSALD